MTILSVFFEVISPKHTRACSSLKRWPRSLQTAWHAVCRLREVSRLHGTHMLIKESLCVCNANKLPLFAGVFSTPPPVSPYYRITTVHVQRTLHIRWLRIRSIGTQVCSKPHFHNVRPGSAGLANPSIYTYIHIYYILYIIYKQALS